ncbi:MAG: hypothetical protein IIY12_03635 [Clostridia bacterium]|nr:hypothetical protein [Clostridia bacterium]MBQ1965716.1 hypothetical protein [Clostridia bacterium]MBQ5743252.1 hypothetical protein [Clostridia bacterium]
MDSCWNRDYRKIVINFLSPVTGPITTEFLSNADGSVAIEQLRGEPNLICFVDGSRLSRYDFNLYVRTNGRDTASRKKAMDTLMAAANHCASHLPFSGAYIEMTEFPHLFNRNMSGNEEYQAQFSMFFRTGTSGDPLNIPTQEVEV